MEWSLDLLSLECVYYESERVTCLPVVSGDACGTGPCRLLCLLIVVGVHVGLVCLLLQNLPKLILSDTAEERTHLVGILDHPLYVCLSRLARVVCVSVSE